MGVLWGVRNSGVRSTIAMVFSKAIVVALAFVDSFVVSNGDLRADGMGDAGPRDRHFIRGALYHRN